MLGLSQFLVVGHKRDITKECGSRDHPVCGVSRERISELTGALGDLIREGFDTIFRQPPYLCEPF
jgi:hypothetical protein